MTIYALSTGPGVSGIAIIRVSGEDTSKVIKFLTGGQLPKARIATLRKTHEDIIDSINHSVAVAAMPFTYGSSD